MKKALTYTPLLLLVALIGVVLVISRFEENSKYHQVQTIVPNAAKSPVSADQAGQKTAQAEQPVPPPNWSHTFTWPEGVTAWAVIFTLLVIAWQSVETRRAAEASLSSLEMTKTKERAKVMLRVWPLNPMLGEIPEARFSVVNAGESTALCGFAAAGLAITDSENTKEGFSSHTLTKTEWQPLKSEAFFEERAYVVGNPLLRNSRLLIDGQEHIHLRGQIDWKDAFDDRWQLVFHYVWRQYEPGTFVPSREEGTTGYWYPCDVEERHDVRPKHKHAPWLWKS